MWILVILTDLLLTLLRRFRKTNNTIVKKARDSLRNSYPYKLWISTCVEFFYAAILQLRQPTFHDAVSSASWGIALIALIMVLIFPIHCFIIFAQNLRSEIKNPLFTEYGGDKGDNKKYFLIVYLVKRILSAFVIVAFYYHPSLEISCIILLSVSYMVMLFIFRPRESKLENLYDIFPEFVMFSVNLMIKLLHSNSDVDFQNKISLTIIVFIFTVVLVLLGRIFVEQISWLKSLFSRKTPPKSRAKKLKPYRVRDNQPDQKTSPRLLMIRSISF